MTNEPKVFLSKLLQKSPADRDTKSHMYLRSRWLDDSIELLVQDTITEKCYKGHFRKEELEEAATDLDMPSNKLYEEVFEALTTNLLPGFITEIELEEPGNKFKLLKQQEFEVAYVEVQLREVQNNHELLETAIELIETAASLHGKKEAVPETTTSNGKDQSADALPAEERTKLLKKFAMLLNAKKAKIEELQEKLEQLQDNDIAMRSNYEEENELSHKPSTSRKLKRSAQEVRKAKRAYIEDEDGEDDDFTAMTQPMTATELNRQVGERDNSGESDGV